MKNHQPNQPHAQAEDSREVEDFHVSLELAIDSELSYEDQGDMIGMSEVQSSKALAYRHLFHQTKTGAYLVLAKHAALAGVEIAQNSGIKEALAIPTFNLAKIYEEIEENETALRLYEEALVFITEHPPEHQNRKAVKLDFKLHLLILKLKMGDKTVLDEIKETISYLAEQTDESDYNRKTWISGAYLKLARILKEFEYLDEARKIIESDKRLGLRNIQWQELTEELE
jgi:tetratricopeptide (TPR) repeat protein